MPILRAQEFSPLVGYAFLIFHDTANNFQNPKGAVLDNPVRSGLSRPMSTEPFCRRKADMITKPDDVVPICGEI